VTMPTFSVEVITLPVSDVERTLRYATSPRFAGKSRSFEQSENQGHCDNPGIRAEFSERNSGSSFFE
jgi:hypothetical protein